jgi:hypothetical protein
MPMSAIAARSSKMAELRCIVVLSVCCLKPGGWHVEHEKSEGLMESSKRC